MIQTLNLSDGYIFFCPVKFNSFDYSHPLNQSICLNTSYPVNTLNNIIYYQCALLVRVTSIHVWPFDVVCMYLII